MSTGKKEHWATFCAEENRIFFLEISVWRIYNDSNRQHKWFMRKLAKFIQQTRFQPGNCCSSFELCYASIVVLVASHCKHLYSLFVWFFICSLHNRWCHFPTIIPQQRRQLPPSMSARASSSLLILVLLRLCHYFSDSTASAVAAFLLAAAVVAIAFVWRSCGLGCVVGSHGYYWHTQTYIKPEQASGEAAVGFIPDVWTES